MTSQHPPIPTALVNSPALQVSKVSESVYCVVSMHESRGTGCVGRVDRSSKIFNPPSPVFKAGASCVLRSCVYAYYMQTS